jgi:Fe-S oxidoreductase
MNTAMTRVQDFQSRLQPIGDDLVRIECTDEQRIQYAKKAFMHKIDGRKAVDLDSCLQCGMCAEACHFYEATKNEKYAPVYKFRLLRRFYRRELSPMRWLYKPFTKDITISELEEWGHLVFDACTGCGRCDMICPMGIKISTLIRVAREGVAAAGFMPADLRVIQKEQLENNTMFGVGAAELRQLVDKLRADGVDVPLDKDGADVMLLTSAPEIQAFPDTFAANARILNKSGVNWTIRSDCFEASNAGFINANDKTLDAQIKRVVDRATEQGIKTLLISECGHGYQIMRWEAANELGKELPFEVLSMPEFMLQELGEGRLALKQQANGASVTYHDPCRLARKGGVMDEPRAVLAAMGFDVRETPASRRENYCCGGGCGDYAIRGAAKLRQKAFAIKQREFDEAGADEVITGCVNCRFNLMVGAQNAGWETPVTSLVETVAANLAD